MNRLYAAVLLLPVLFLSFMTAKARSASKSRSSKRPAARSVANVNAASPLTPLTPEQAKWVDSSLRSMSLEEKIGQLLFTTYHGSFTSTDSEAYANMMHDIDDLHVGGFITITHGSPLGIVKDQAYPTAVLANMLQSKSKLPLLIGADYERGTAMRQDEGTSFPTAMAVAAGGDPKDAYTVGKITALEARAVGVQWVYAPVCDVNNNPGNPIINTRSFGENPQRVSEFVSEFTRGVQENGGLATAKHFPGHGDTATDSHIDLPIIKADRQRMESLELIPFRAAISAGVGSVMTGHLNVPAFEPDPAIPATLSPNILTRLLRDELHFQGLVITDALDMGGITVRYAPGDAAVRAFLAGADALLMPPVPDAAYQALLAAAQSGRISKDRLDASVRRLLEAKARLGLNQNRLVDINTLNEKFGSVAWQATAQEISDRGITLLRDKLHLLPLDGAKPSRALLVSLYADPEPYPGIDLEAQLRSRFDSLIALRADTKFSRADALKLPAPSDYDIVILALFVRVSDRKGDIDVPADQIPVISQIYKSGKPVITLGLGSPYLIERFPQAETWLSAFGISDVAQVSLARALFGEIPIRGQLPVTIPGVGLKPGFGLEVSADPMTLQPMDIRGEAQLQPAFKVVEDAIADKAFPGATLAVGYKGKVSYHAFGKLSYDANSPAVRVDTMYDLASLTKVVVTTTLVEKLAEGDFGQPLNLDTPIERYLPEWLSSGNQLDWRHMVTIRHLMTHTSGLPPFKEYWRTSAGKQDTLSRIFAEPLEYEPGTKMIYSDLGIILMAEIIQRLTGQPLDALANEYIFHPLGMKDSMYNPPKKLWPVIAPTEVDNQLRHRLVQGEVHDENAYAIGGVSGHAGVFSTSPDLSHFCQMLLNGGVYAHQRILQRATIAEFTAPQPISKNERTLGWVVPTASSSSGHYFSVHSYGHTGFTGTTIWIDPDRQLFVILLTNRVNPTRENMKIAQVRPAVHDAIMKALGLATEVTHPD
ncbi:MAG TPA: glycoside hydrolase family 3 N-terminal domain-containing protein [Candidatus Saccharimonadales bacterium]|nr:glycoside hydrolase family 3 N-terminal domain-containing protein [Candidatus Saccharimonadales bacterium]